MRKRTLAREYALQLMYQQELNPVELKDLFTGFWAHISEISDETRQFSERLVGETSKNMTVIDEVISKSIDNWEFDRLAILDKNIMRLGVCELLYFGDIPPKVAINEAVNLAKKFSQEDAGKFVNGVLDKVCHSEKKRSGTPHDKEITS